MKPLSSKQVNNKQSLEGDRHCLDSLDQTGSLREEYNYIKALKCGLLIAAASPLSLRFLFFIFISCVQVVCLLCMYNHVDAWHPQRLERVLDPLELVTDSCELLT